MAGQHLDVRLTDEIGYFAERLYSIAAADGEPVATTVERLETGSC
jgi:ferredoxin-NADP reductase